MVIVRILAGPLMLVFMVVIAILSAVLGTLGWITTGDMVATLRWPAWH